MIVWVYFATAGTGGSQFSDGDQFRNRYPALDERVGFGERYRRVETVEQAFRRQLDRQRECYP